MVGYSERYYYTDPLAALWMHKHFGMKLVHYATQEHVEEYGGALGEEWNWLDCLPMDTGPEIEMTRDVLGWLERCGGKIYIHPDSLHLLEPQNGDIGNCGEAYDKGRWHSGAGMSCGEPEIISRNGIPFMWPEEEITE